MGIRNAVRDANSGKLSLTTVLGILVVTFAICGVLGVVLGVITP